MFKLYNQVSAVKRFSNGYSTEFIDSIDSMQCWQVPEGMAYICPEKPDYYYGHAVNLFTAPNADVTGEELVEIWDQHIALKAPKAIKRIITWETSKFIEYKNIDPKFDPENEVILKYSANKPAISRQTYNIQLLTKADEQQMVDIYVADAGEAQRDFIAWRSACRMADIEAGGSHFFAIWNRDKNEIAAIAGLYWCDGIFRYASVNTRKSYRGRGYCSALIAHIRDFALANGAKQLYIVATKGSQAAGIYMNAGFEVSSYEYSIMTDR